eukprot:TRINITY_DN5970_c0_g1_i1.p1 TRINITY_DN5970_c0_g1~~TRINITY_DN5970_c0_g1_i1.p1  ORF type:complete len:227 (-),score=55.42 TRINITY_DN5970_c0_g1_i1:319-999(-)
MDQGQQKAKNNAKVPRVKILLMGSDGCGKTSLLTRFVKEDWEESPSNILEEGNREILFEENKYLIELKDKSPIGRDSHYASTSTLKYVNGVFILFDPFDLGSWDQVSDWMKEIEAYGEKKIQKVLISTKCDLSPNDRAVPYDEVKAYAEKLRIDFFEVSAKTGDGLLDAITRMVALCTTTKQVEEKKKERVRKLSQGESALITADIGAEPSAKKKRRRLFFFRKQK